jgi:hypothetical protein
MPKVTAIIHITEKIYLPKANERDWIRFGKFNADWSDSGELGSHLLSDAVKTSNL